MPGKNDKVRKGQRNGLQGRGYGGQDRERRLEKTGEMVRAFDFGASRWCARGYMEDRQRWVDGSTQKLGLLWVRNP